MKHVIASVLFLTLSAYCFSSNDSLKVIIKLKSITNVLTFNQPHVAPGALEYLWEVKIDSDNNTNTGDNDGYDVGLVLENIKFGTSPSYTGSIISGTDQHTWIYNGSSKIYGNQLFAYFNFPDSTISLIGFQSWPELINVNSGDRISARTYFNSVTGAQRDSTIATTICNNPLVDAQGDIQSPFMDLASIKVELPITVNITEEKSDKNKLVIFPNPGTGMFYLKNIAKKIEVYDALGIKILSLQNGSTIDLQGFPKGIYLMKIQRENDYFSTKVTVY